jgi:hypothetical protein
MRTLLFLFFLLQAVIVKIQAQSNKIGSLSYHNVRFINPPFEDIQHNYWLLATDLNAYVYPKTYILKYDENFNYLNDRTFEFPTFAYLVHENLGVITISDIGSADSLSSFTIGYTDANLNLLWKKHIIINKGYETIYGDIGARLFQSGINEYVGVVMVSGFAFLLQFDQNFNLLQTKSLQIDHAGYLPAALERQNGWYYFLFHPCSHLTPLEANNASFKMVKVSEDFSSISAFNYSLNAKISDGKMAISDDGNILLGLHYKNLNNVNVFENLLITLDTNLQVIDSKSIEPFDGLKQNGRIHGLSFLNDDKILLSTSHQSLSSQSGNFTISIYDQSGQIFENITKSTFFNSIIYENYMAKSEYSNKIIFNQMEQSDTIENYVGYFLPQSMNLCGFNPKPTFELNGFLFPQVSAASASIHDEQAIVFDYSDDYFQKFIIVNNSCSSLSLNEQIIGSEQFVIPNPCKEYFEISEDIQPKEISIIDLSGKVIFSRTQGSHRVDISGIATGVYFLKITDLSGRIYLSKQVIM